MPKKLRAEFFSKCHFFGVLSGLERPKVPFWYIQNEKNCYFSSFYCSAKWSNFLCPQMSMVPLRVLGQQTRKKIVFLRILCPQNFGIPSPVKNEFKGGFFFKHWIDSQINFAAMAPFLSDYVSQRYDSTCVRCAYVCRLLYIPSTWSDDP